jgi:thioredoxin reductase (NADPH)
VLAERLARNPASLVVALCADWCETCRAFRPVFDRLAAAQSDALFLWLDIDDDSAVAGEIEIEGFPSLAVFRSGLPVFFGVAEPQERQLMRVLAAMAEGVLRPLPVPEAVATLPRALVRATAAPDGG